MCVSVCECVCVLWKRERGEATLGNGCPKANEADSISH